jgi:hypothetical protein
VPPIPAERKRPLSRATRLTLASYLIAAIAVTWRLWLDPASRTVPGNPGDADLFAWYMRYAADAVAHGHWPALVTSALNAPAGVNLMWNSSMLLPAVLVAPVTLLFGPQVSLTLLTTIGFAGSAAAMFGVLRRWQVSQSAAALAGAVYGFSPALLHSAIGHYDLQLAILPPLIVDAMLRLAVAPSESASQRASDAAAVTEPRGAWPSRLPQHVRTGLTLGALLAAQLFISEELALTTVLTGLLLVVCLATGYPRQAVRRARVAVAGLAIAACTTLVLAGWGLWVQFFGPLAQSGTPFTRDFYVNDLSNFVIPSGYLLFHTQASAAAAALYRGQAPEYLAYLGWPLIIVAAIAAAVFWLRPVVRALGGTAAVLVLLSLGGYPLVAGASHTSWLLPWHWLENLPLAGSVLPDRLSILIDGLVAALLAVLLDLARTRLRASESSFSVLAGVWAVLVCLPLVPLPLPATTVTPLPSGWATVLTELHLAPDARVLVVPVPDVHLTMAMRWEADSSRQLALVGGYFIGPAWNGTAYVDGNGSAATSKFLNQLWAAGLRPGSALQVLTAGIVFGAPALPAASQVTGDLATWHLAAVVAVTSRGSALATYLTSLFGQPAASAGSTIAWRLRYHRSPPGESGALSARGRLTRPVA